MTGHVGFNKGSIKYKYRDYMARHVRFNKGSIKDKYRDAGPILLTVCCRQVAFINRG